MKFIKQVLLIFIMCSSLHAQDILTENTAPVALHEKRVSSFTFNLNQRRSSLDKKADPALNLIEDKTAYLLFTPKDPSVWEEDQKALIYHMPKACEQSRVELEEVFHHTEGSDDLDLLVYDLRSKEQSKLALKFKSAVTPWDPTYDPAAGHETIDARMQDLARVLNPDCLPARFRFIYSGAKRYQEIRYGNKAFDQ